jgi:hypothetical protein
MKLHSAAATNPARTILRRLPFFSLWKNLLLPSDFGFCRNKNTTLFKSKEEQPSHKRSRIQKKSAQS